MIHPSLNGRPARRLPAPAVTPDGRRTKARPRRRLPAADKVLYWSATVAPWGLSILLLAVSMPHLATGFTSVCRCGPLAGWLLAVAIDSAQVVAKLQLTVAGRYTTSAAAKWTSAGIVAGSTVMSMSLNVLAFLTGATDDTGTVLAWAAGVMLPLMVLALSYTGSCFALAKPKSSARSKSRPAK